MAESPEQGESGPDQAAPGPTAEELITDFAHDSGKLLRLGGGQAGPAQAEAGAPAAAIEEEVTAFLALTDLAYSSKDPAGSTDRAARAVDESKRQATARGGRRAMSSNRLLWVVALGILITAVVVLTMRSLARTAEEEAFPATAPSGASAAGSSAAVPSASAVTETASGGAGALAGVPECAAPDSVAVTASMTSDASGTVGTTYQGTVAVRNTSTAPVVVAFRWTYSNKDATGAGDSGEGWNGAQELAPDAEWSEYIVAQHFDQTDVLTWKLITDVAPYAAGGTCQALVSRSGDAALDALAIPVDNPFPVSPG